MTSPVHPSTSQGIERFVAQPSHAVLLAGANGTDKNAIATSLAAQLLVTTEVGLMNHTYYRVVSPVKGVITIEQIRQLISFFRLAVPGSADVKRVALVQSADTMGHEAQNAILKLLEEPPVGSVLILTADRLQGLLPTIQSRLQTITVQKPTDEQIAKHFADAGYTASDVAKAQLRTGGDLAETEALLSVGTASPDEALELVKRTLGASTYQRLLLVDGLTKQKELLRTFIDTLMQVATVSLEAAAGKQTATVERWRGILQASYTAQSALASNGNPKLVLTDLMLSL